MTGDTFRADNYDKRIFTPSILFGDLSFLLANGVGIAGAARRIGRDFMGKIMMVVSAVNGCSYCSWFHASQAMSSGMSADEVRDMFNLQFETFATEHELPALLYAQHFAETNRNPDPEMTARLVDFYGEKTARDVALIIRMIYFGNLLGNTFDAFPSRLAGRPANNSSALFEFMFYLAVVWFMQPAKWMSRGKVPTMSKRARA